MTNKNLNNNSIPISQVGNFTKHAIETFEKNIVNQHNYLEKVQNNLSNKK
ncbi:hypothetical protein H9X78_13895 [Clostridium saudiense]|nr:hypothetical protein [Clostridium saudiense]